MSGPKTSQYHLTPEQRAQLELQRKIRVELKLLDTQRKEAVQILSDTEELVRRARAMSREDAIAEQTAVMTESLRKRLEEFTRMDEASGLDSLRNAGEEFDRSLRELDRQGEILKEHMSELESDFRRETGKKILGGFRLNFDKPAGGGNVKLAEILAQVEKDYQAVRHMHLSETLMKRLEESLAKAREIKDPEFLKNYRAMSQLPLIQECREYHALYEAEGAQFRRKLAIYRENCLELGLPPRNISFGIGALQELEQLLHQTEAALAFREEQAYISRCMDEAMEELGYSLLGHREVTKRSGKKFRNALYLFDEGTAVNVTFADNGQITMELGGMDDRDRLPTARETRALVREMDNFCLDFGKLEGILLDKGVKSKRISILPSHEQYAQIINVSDYEMNGPVSFFHAEEGRRPAEKQKERKMGE